MKIPLLFTCALFALIGSAADDWTILFNGENLDGWSERNKSGSFRAEDGAIIGTAKEGLGTTFLCTDKMYGDFELEYETKLIDSELNSGVQIRSKNRPTKGKQKAGPIEGPQIEFSASNPEKGTFSGNIYGQSWGEWLTPKDKRVKNTFVKGGEWNKFRVVAKGDQVTVWINGNKVGTTTIRAERHTTNPSGMIGLQIHGIKPGLGPFEVAWRNLRIRELKDERQPSTSTDPSSTVGTTITTGRIPLTHVGPEKAFPKLPKLKDHTLTVFATAPQINSPVSVVAEPGGAVLAICDNNAGLGQLPEQGTVYRLVDENDDGRADYATKFVEKINTPRGGHFLNDTLYLVHPPYISSYRDRDGDGVAEEHKILARGFGHDHVTWKRGGDHTTNDLRVGVDGWIYIAVGDFGATAVGSDGSKVTLMTGGVIRIRLDGSDLELCTQGTRNTYDLAVSPRMDIIAMDNTNDGDGWDMRLHHLTPLAHMGYPNLYKFFNDDAMPPLFSYGGGSGCGALFLQEPGFPEWFNNRLHTISWGNLYTHDLEPNEATFTVKSEVTLKMNKLVDIDVDGSSRLYFNNFENGGARTAPGTVVGRIIQAKPKGWTYRAFPELKTATPKQLATYLDSGSNVLRQHAQWALIQHTDSSVDNILLAATKNSGSTLEARIAALYAINLRNASSAVASLKALLADADLCEYALRALLDRDDRNTLGLEAVITSLLDHKNPRVRLQAIVGAERLKLSGLSEKLLILADGSEARAPLTKDVAHVHNAIPHTARRALISLQPVADLHRALEHPEQKNAALAVIQQIHTTDNVQRLVSAFEHTKQIDARMKLVGPLMRLYHREHDWDGQEWWGTRPNSAGPYFSGITWEGSDAIAETLRKAVDGMDEASQKAVLFQLGRHNLEVKELGLNLAVDPLEQLVGQPEHTFKQHADLLGVVTDKKRPMSMRIKAFRVGLEVKGANYSNWCLATLQALKKIGKEKDLYATLRQDFVNSPAHRISLIHQVPRVYDKARRLGAEQEAAFLDMICTLAQSPLTSPKDQEKVVGGMRRHPLSQALLDSILRNRATSFLSLLERAKRDKKLGTEVNRTIAALKAKDGRLVGSMPFEEMKKVVLTTTGDAETGKQLYMRQGCIACHSILPSEPQKGPFLGTVGNLFNRDQLITHVAKPGAEVAQGFQAYWFKLKNGSTAEGFITARNDKTIRLRNIVGIAQVLATSDVTDEGVREGSMMPPGLVNNLTLTEFASLIDYLERLH